MRLFIREHTSIIALHLLQFFYLYCTFRWLDEKMVEGNIVYLFLVSLFLLIVFLAFRYAAGHSGYRWLSRVPDWNDAKTFLHMDVASPLLRAFKEGLARQFQLMQRESEKSIREIQERIDFMNRFVHLMKTPISALHLIVQDREDTDGAEEMRMEIHRMEYLLNMILTLSRMSSFRQDFHIQSVWLHPLAYEVVNELKNHFIHRQIYPVVEIPPDVRVLSDRKWLKFVLTQLLTNAIRYTGGENKSIRVYAEPQGNRMTLVVEDEGVGIPPQDLPRIFDLYFTGVNGRKFGESTGIGLYLVRKICNELDHDVSVESSSGVGTKFTILFPVSDHPGDANVTNL
jgi:signal transduction histidine kinase